MDWAFSNGTDFIIQMDQDSILEKGTVIKLLKSYQLLTNKGYKIGV
jgi:rhamnosyltransferase